MKPIELAVLTLTSILLLACQDDDTPKNYAGDASVKVGDATVKVGDASVKYDAQSPRSTSCEQWCDVRASRTWEDGFCLPRWNWNAPDESCEVTCSVVVPQDRSEAALQACIEDAALCFLSLEDCITYESRLAVCTEWCDFRTTEHANEGFCEDTSCPNTCVFRLAEGLSAQSVEDCVRDNPLCHVDLRSCAQ